MLCTTRVNRDIEIYPSLSAEGYASPLKGMSDSCAGE